MNEKKGNKPLEPASKRVSKASEVQFDLSTFSERPGKKFDLSLLDEAVFRNLVHYVMILGLDASRLTETDTLDSWAEKSEVQLTRTDEGGAVAKRANGKFVFISEQQLQQVQDELLHLFK